MSILNTIQGYEDLVALNDQQRSQLCAEIRDFLVSHIARTGGHLASNLGVVELSVALETVYNTKKDRLVFDVGHQSYVHKMLTGRQADFVHLRQYGGISGFTKPSESEADAFVAGHASNSVSIALGMARARTLLHEDYHVAAVIGDGATTGGMAFEGLNDAAVSREPIVIILNDNEMSISRNVGGLARHLSRLRSKTQYLELKKQYRRVILRIPGGKTIYRVSKQMKDRIKRMLLPSTIFENMGLMYLGPVDGHDLPGLIALLRTAKKLNEPVLVHVVTKKGMGYLPAEEQPSKFHGIGEFDAVSGKTKPKMTESFSDSFGNTMVELAKSDPRVCAITAAMPDGTGLRGFRDAYPDRLFDVGIAEEHAVSMAGGLAKQGMTPVVAIYSTFLQRAFDQIMQDVALQHLHVVLAVDRAGLVGEDGATHHGVFDVGYLRLIPGMRILAPLTISEQKEMLTFAVSDYCGPIAVRYPRGGNTVPYESAWNRSEGRIPDVVCQRPGKDVAFITYGTLTNNVVAAAEELDKAGISAAVIRLLTVAPVNAVHVKKLLSQVKHVLIVEEVCAYSGISEGVSAALYSLDPELRITYLNLGEEFVTHGSMKDLYHHYGLDSHTIAAAAKEALEDEK